MLNEVEHEEWRDVLLLDALPLRQREYSEDDPFSWERGTTTGGFSTRCSPTTLTR